MSGAEATSRGRHLAIVVSLVYILLWSSAYTAIKFGVRYAPPLTFLTLRFLLASVMMAVFVQWIGQPWPRTVRAWLRLGIYGVLNLGAPAALNFIALRHASAGMASMVLVANPLLLALLAPRLLGEKLTTTKVAGLVFGFLGVTIVMAGRLGAKGRVDEPLGVTLLFLAVVCMVVATVVFKRFPPREPLLMVNVVQQLVSAVLLVPAVLLLEHPTHMVINVTFLLALLHLVLVVSIGASLIWFWLLGKGEASVVSSSLFLSPIVGLAFAAITLGEHLTARDGVGLVGVTLGVLLIRRAPKQAAAMRTSIRPPTAVPAGAAGGERGVSEIPRKASGGG